ncbi:MAG: AAA family ATPase [Limisphaerales bacterium]
MNTKRLPANDVPVLPELEPLPDAFLGGSELLDEDASAQASIRYLESRRFASPDLSFFTLPVYDQLRQRPYHEVVVQGPFDTRRLAHDYREYIYRSEVIILQGCPPSVDGLLLCLGQGVFVLHDGTNLTVIAPTPQAAAKVAADFRQYVKPFAKAKPGFHLVSFGPDGPYVELIEVDTCPAADAEELALHYGADFPAWEQQWLAQLARRRSGVTILFGPPGVGKTSYLKMLMGRFLDRFSFYYVPLSSFALLSAPGFVGFWLDQNRGHPGKVKLAIIEDAENLLLPRDERSRAQVSNLLNIGDGFLGEHLKIHVVATTNVPIRQLDEAVRRPGRLVGSREFRRLTRAEALRLAQVKGLTLTNGSDTWSLAEIYNGLPEVLALEPKVGFAARA